MTEWSRIEKVIKSAKCGGVESSPFENSCSVQGCGKQATHRVRIPFGIAHALDLQLCDSHEEQAKTLYDRTLKGLN